MISHTSSGERTPANGEFWRSRWPSSGSAINASQISATDAPATPAIRNNNEATTAHCDSGATTVRDWRGQRPATPGAAANRSQSGAPTQGSPRLGLRDSRGETTTDGCWFASVKSVLKRAMTRTAFTSGGVCDLETLRNSAPLVQNSRCCKRDIPTSHHLDHSTAEVQKDGRAC